MNKYYSIPLIFLILCCYSDNASAISLTLDTLNSKDDTSYPIKSAFDLKETNDQTGDNIFYIPTYDKNTQEITDKYYSLNIRDGVSSESRLSNTTNKEDTNFIGHYFNLAQNTTSSVSGGAITTNANSKMGNIIGDFINNTISTSGNSYAGAIYNLGIINSISGDFYKNSTTSSKGNVAGGAIYNSKTLTQINGNFISNAISTTGSSKYAYGGAIYNSGTINSIIGDLHNNSATSEKYYAYGGAVYNSGTITSISGNLHNNSTTSENNLAYGGAIYNNSTINSISGNITGNSTFSQSNKAYGGAIYNNKKIVSIVADMIGNSAISEKAGAIGGAIYNNGTIDLISGNFIENSSHTNNQPTNGSISATNIGGGAIRSNGLLGEINGLFKNNKVLINSSLGSHTAPFSGCYTRGYDSGGGAIYFLDGSSSNNPNGTTINADFIGNSVIETHNFHSAYDPSVSTSGNLSAAYTGGGAIYNAKNGRLDKIKGNFIGNSYQNKIIATSAYQIDIESSGGGAIYGRKGINYIEGNFKNNTVNFDISVDIPGALRTRRLGGGAINTGNSITSITGDFENNSTNINLDIDNAFIVNMSNSGGGAISSRSSIGSITGNFIGNYARINVETKDNINSINMGGGAIFSASSLGDITGNFENNYTETNYGAFGGGILALGKIENITGNFINNHAKTTNKDYLALGGAIYFQNTTKNEENKLNLTADGKNIVFSGNYTEDSRGKINNAIFIRTNDKVSEKDNNGTIKYIDIDLPSSVVFNAKNNGSFLINDTIDGGDIILKNFDREYFSDDYTKSSLDIYFNGLELVREKQYNLLLTGDDSGIISLNNDILNANITHENITTYVSNGQILSHPEGDGINSLTLNSGILNISKLSPEKVKFQKLSMSGGEINIGTIDVDLKNSKMGKIEANEYGDITGGNINISKLNLVTSSNKYKTNILFADTKLADKVNYLGEKLLVYSPIYVYSVDYDTLNNGGYFTFKRYVGINNPAILVAPIASRAIGTSNINRSLQTGLNRGDAYISCKLNKHQKNCLTDNLESHKGKIWVEPYATFEDIPLKNAPRVDHKEYGVLFGFDSKVIDLENNFSSVVSIYAGHNNNNVEYTDVEMDLKGGTLGAMAILFNNKFFTEFGASIGYATGEAKTMYGKEDFDMFMAGFANKTGYNFNINDNITIQPSVFIEYNYINLFDYTNAANIKIKNSGFNNLQIAPGIKIIGNITNEWQAYIGFSKYWDLISNGTTIAEDDKLPDITMKPYMKYNIGLQNNWTQKYSTYFNTSIYSGGKIGTDISFGLKWKF